MLDDEVSDHYEDLRELLTTLSNSSNPYSALLSELNVSTLIDYYDYAVAGTSTSYTHVVVLVTFGLAFLLGVAGNGLVIYVVCKHGPMKTATNVFFVNLAVSDLLFLCSCVPFTAITYVMPEWPLGDLTCKIVNYVNVVSMVAAVLTLTAMGIDRYHAVVRPVQSRNYRTVSRTLLFVASIWLLDILLVIPTATISQIKTFWDRGEPKEYCVLYFHSTGKRQLYTLSLFLFFYVGPLLVIGVCYFLMVKNLWTRVQPGALCLTSASSHKSRRRIAKMVLVVVATFAFCWLPIHCIHLRNDFGQTDYSYTNYVIGIGAHALSYINSAINPIIYSFMSKNFRECFRAAFCCKKVVQGTLFIVVEHGPKKSSSNSNQKGGTRSSSEPRSPFPKTNKPDVRSTVFPLCPVEEEGANPDMVAVGVV